MYCKNCGKQLDDSAVVCPHCGVPTDNFYKPDSAVSAQPYNPAGSRQPSPEPKPLNAFAITALVLGIIGIWLGIFFCVIPILGLIFSIMGLNKAASTNSGRGLAIGGLITSIISICLWALYWLTVIFSGSIVYY